MSEALAPVYSTTLGADELLAARSSDASFSVLVAQGGVPAFADHLDPNGSGAGDGPSTLAGIDVSFLSENRALGAHLAGTFDGDGILAHVLGGASLATPHLGCSSIQPVRAGAVPSGDGWLDAISTGAPFGSCDDPGVVPDLPRRIDVVRVGLDASLELLGAIEVGETIVDLQVALHPDGMYVVWSEAGSATGGAIHAARVSLGAQLLAAGPSPVTAAGDLEFWLPSRRAGPPAAGALGSMLSLVLA